MKRSGSLRREKCLSQAPTVCARDSLGESPSRHKLEVESGTNNGTAGQPSGTRGQVVLSQSLIVILRLSGRCRKGLPSESAGKPSAAVRMRTSTGSRGNERTRLRFAYRSRSHRCLRSWERAQTALWPMLRRASGAYGDVRIGGKNLHVAAVALVEIGLPRHGENQHIPAALQGAADDFPAHSSGFIVVRADEGEAFASRGVGVDRNYRNTCGDGGVDVRSHKVRVRGRHQDACRLGLGHTAKFLLLGLRIVAAGAGNRALHAQFSGSFRESSAGGLPIGYLPGHRYQEISVF